MQPSMVLPSLMGVITDQFGTPLRGVIVELTQGGTSGEVYKTVSQNDGGYLLQGLSLTGEVVVSFYKEDSLPVIRKFRSPEELKAINSLNISLLCCDSGLPIPPHAKEQPLSATYYVGQYDMLTVCKTSRHSGTRVQLQEGKAGAPSRCLCTNLALLSAKDGGQSYACWRVKEDGDIEVSFPCEGLAFAGGTWTLWKKGKSLIGYSSGVTDSGCPPPICEVTLMLNEQK